MVERAQARSSHAPPRHATPLGGRPGRAGRSQSGQANRISTKAGQKALSPMRCQLASAAGPNCSNGCLRARGLLCDRQCWDDFYLAGWLEFSRRTRSSLDPCFRPAPSRPAQPAPTHLNTNSGARESTRGRQLFSTRSGLPGLAVAGAPWTRRPRRENTAIARSAGPVARNARNAPTARCVLLAGVGATARPG